MEQPPCRMMFTRDEVTNLVFAALLDSADISVDGCRTATAAVVRNVWPLIEELQQSAPEASS